MVMQRGESELRRLGDNDLANIMGGVWEAFVKRHPNLKDISLSSVIAPVEMQSADLITSAVAECKKGPLTPELVTKTFRTIWQEREKLVPEELAGVKFEVSPCPFTIEELASREKKGLRLGYLPQVLATQENRHILSKMFPKMQSASIQEGNNVTNDQNPFGWFDYEASIDAPYLDTTEKQLVDKLGEKNRQLLSENQYIIAGQDSKLFVGEYLDEKNTSVRVGSCSEGHLVNACFSSDGSLDVRWDLGPRRSDPSLGGRSSGVNRT